MANWTQIQTLFTSAGTQLFFRDTQLQLLAKRDDAELSGISISEVERSGIGRLDLRDALLNGLIDKESPVIHWNKEFIRYYDLDNGRVRVEFSDGTFEEGDLLVGADGPKSMVRQQYLPEIKRLDLGVIVIAGRCLARDINSKDLPSEILDGSLNNIVPHGKGWMFVSAWKSRSPTEHDRRQDLEHYVVWAYVVPQEQTPPNIYKFTEEQLQDLVLQATQRWSSGLRHLVRASNPSTVKRLSLKSMPRLTPWTPSNVTVLGDAIHNMTPMAGMGANTALRDSEVLTRVLVDYVSKRVSLVDAVGIYEQEMRSYSNEAVALSRRNAENASKGGSLSRLFFRGLLRAAQASPTIMRATLGQGVVKAV